MFICFVFHMFIHSCPWMHLNMSNYDTFHVPPHCVSMGDGPKFQHACFFCVDIFARFCFDVHNPHHVD